ncbi:TNT domain-containing protein [Eubacteriales bacterium OttesenSCG-928-K08]|nr:TNT domain-containing protein [Eubacteriales bacterium OttesenSCG-928-K08]
MDHQEKTVLQPGETIDRFGADTDTFVSMKGTPWNARSLPAGSQYHYCYIRVK